MTNEQLSAHVVKKAIHRSKPWASYWLDRYNKEGIDGLKDRLKSGGPPEIPEELAIGIRKELLEGKQGWTTTKQVSDIHNIQKRWSKIDITILTSTEYFTQVGIQTEDTKKSTHQYCFKGGERGFQKRTKEVT